MDFNVFLKSLFARAQEAGINPCEAYIASNESFEVSALDGEIQQYTVNDKMGLSFRGICQGKMGYAATEAYDEEAIKQLIDGVMESATLTDDESEQFIYKGDLDYPDVCTFNPELEEVSAQEKLNLVLSLEKYAISQDERVKKSGENGVFTESNSIRIVNSYGLDISFKRNNVGCYVAPIARDGDSVKNAFEINIGSDFEAINPETMAKTAVNKVISCLHASPVPSGKYHCVLRYDAIVSLLGCFASVFSSENTQKGMSLLNGKTGKKIAADCVCLTDDPLMDDGLASRPFDAEGVKCETKNIIEKGVLKTLLYNLKTAKIDGVKTTGNASKSGYASPVTVAPTNFFFAPGTASLEELLKEIDNGLMITDFSGLHAGANVTTGDFSLLSEGFLIENGKISRPVDQITVAGNFYQLLKNIRCFANDLKFPHSGIGSPSADVGEMDIAGK